MSFKSRRELLFQVAPRYRASGRKEKSAILKEFIASTGYSRKYAIRLLSLREIPSIGVIRRPRSRHYGKEVQGALQVVWAAANYIGSKRLAPFLQELVPVLEKHGHLKLTEDVRAPLLSISHATIDRLLGPIRAGDTPRGISTTKAGTLLKHQIPIRTFADWDEKKPGFFEGDLVAHCGTSMEGAFLNTLVLTDIETGWVECMALLTRSGEAVTRALDHVRQLLPVAMLGLDTDNGSEFINADLLAYCKQESITFTRGRAYKKNDQCYVEQKNGIVVRQLVGYDRFEGMKAYRQLTELYRAVRLYVNFFQPSMKLLKKQREGSKVRRTYDIARTPYQRLCNAGVLTAERSDRLKDIYQALDPVHLLDQIRLLQNALWQHAVLPDRIGQIDKAEAELKAELRFQVSGFGLTGGAEKGEDRNDWIIPSKQREKRKYRKMKKPRVQHWWRTRKDPFEDVWSEVCQSLEANPERTAKSLLQGLIERYPSQYQENQLRTLQRRVQAWRAKAILTFDDEWLQEEVLAEGTMSQKLRVIMEPNGTKIIQPSIDT